MEFNVVIEDVNFYFISVETGEFLLFRGFSENNCKFCAAKWLMTQIQGKNVVSEPRFFLPLVHFRLLN